MIYSISSVAATRSLGVEPDAFSSENSAASSSSASGRAIQQPRSARARVNKSGFDNGRRLKRLLNDTATFGGNLQFF